MVSNFPEILATFVHDTKRIREIIGDTRKCFKEINSYENEDSNQSLHAQFSVCEELEIEKFITNPPGIILFGQSFYSKAVIANRILEQTLFPIDSICLENDKKWRMVEITYSKDSNIGLGLAGTSLELANHLTAYDQPWQTLPIQDLLISSEKDEEDDECSLLSLLEVQLNHTLLRNGAVLTVSQTGYGTVSEHLEKCASKCVPIAVYAFSEPFLSLKDLEELEQFRKLSPDTHIFFVRVPKLPIINDVGLNQSCSSSDASSNKTELDTMSTRSTICSLASSKKTGGIFKFSPFSQPEIDELPTVLEEDSKCVFHQLLELGFLTAVPNNNGKNDYNQLESELCENFDSFRASLCNFSKRILTSHVLKATTLLNVVHNRCLQAIIDTAFDMARDVMVTPKRLEYVKSQEDNLYKNLYSITVKNQDDIKAIICETLDLLRDSLLERAEMYEFIGIDLPEGGEITSTKDLKQCTGQIEELVLGNLNAAISGKLLDSINILRNSYTGVLQRTLQSLEEANKENIESSRTTTALSEILTAAYQVDITVKPGSSFLRVLLEKMKQLIQSMPWKSPPTVTKEWKRKVASDMLCSLNENRLAKTICNQIQSRLKNSHQTFSAALRQLEFKHSGRLIKTEDRRVKVRKVFAPKVARLALESVSMKDFIVHGMPNYTKEIGRGQYGVVYACESWAGTSPCAVKSVVPPDDRHWNDLALEFYYTKSIPEHDRVVGLKGSVIDYNYGNGSSPAVLLIMPKYERDLHAAIKTGLDWLNRLRVAIDVVQGIRYLHSRGLVHRDIKLKNVLLDKMNRGKLTDLGFCKPEAMMSGSIVGTPIHMAPELFNGIYDNTVDVYAFGILFWYLCSGSVKLPFSYDQCSTKDTLWRAVKHGTRPERLPQFDEDCWELMKSCWHGNASKRPLLGNVETKLNEIRERALIASKDVNARGSKRSSRLK